MRRHLAILLLLAGGYTSAQVISDPREDNFLERRIETIAENSPEEIDYTTIFENLSYFQEHPLDLNFASPDELQQLYLLTDFQIAALMNHREKFGKLLSIWELQAVEGFTLPVIYQMLPFVKVGRELDRLTISWREMLKNATQEAFVRVSQITQQQKGFSPASPEELEANPNARYLGSPQRVFTRYRFKYGTRISAGLTAEKDAGEEFFRGSQKQGFDFYTAHISVKNIGRLKALNLGDYQAHFGQGLTFWSGFSFGKTADALNIKRTAQGLRPYTSVNENLFLRGIGTTIGFGKFEATVFGSYKKVNTNASAIDTLSQDIQVFSNFNLSGFHRTPRELQNRANINEQIYGGHLAFRRRTLNIGVTAVKYLYSAELQRSDDPYNNFEFRGRENTNIGLDYNWIYKNFNFFGEFARSANGGLAMTHGFIASLDPRLSLSFLHRNFARDYQAIYSAAIGEASRNINERGTYIGFLAKPFRAVSLSAYFDRWNYPWLKYLVDAPSQGYDALVQLNYTPSKVLEMYVRYRDRERPRNTPSSEDLDIDFPVAQQQRNIRFDITYRISPSFRLRNRVEYVFFRQPGTSAQNETGYLLLQDVFYKPLSSKLSFSFRYALFQTDGFNSRIYAYENDVLYSFSIPALSNKGSRTYINIEYNLSRNLDIWLRYSQFYYYDRNSTGSGLSEIQGPRRSEIKLQARLKF